MKAYELTKFPVRGLVFEICNSLDDLAEAVANSCIYLQNANIPYNVLITDRGARVFVLPQCFAERQARGEVDQTILDTQVNPAVWEISGHIVLKRRSDYEEATEEYAWKLLAEVSLPKDRFEEVKKECLNAAFEGGKPFPSSDFHLKSSSDLSVTPSLEKNLAASFGSMTKSGSLDGVVPDHGSNGLSVEV